MRTLEISAYQSVVHDRWGDIPHTHIQSWKSNPRKGQIVTRCDTSFNVQQCSTPKTAQNPLHLSAHSRIIPPGFIDIIVSIVRNLAFMFQTILGLIVETICVLDLRSCSSSMHKCRLPRYHRQRLQIICDHEFTLEIYLGTY